MPGSITVLQNSIMRLHYFYQPFKCFRPPHVSVIRYASDATSYGRLTWLPLTAQRGDDKLSGLLNHIQATR